jgi:WD40 repeat protein
MLTNRPTAARLLLLGMIALSISICVLPFIAQNGSAAAQEKQDGTDEKAIRALIAQLGEDTYQKREDADKRLLEVGRPALPLLRKAAKENPDAEVRERAEKLLQAISVKAGTGVIFPESLIFDIVFTKDGQSFAVACDDKAVRFFDWKTNKLKQTLKGHTARVWSLAFSPDGNKLVSCSGDYGNAKGPGEIIIWDLASGKAENTITGHEGGAFGVVFSPDGKTLYSCGGDGTVRSWEFPAGTEKYVGKEHKGPVRRVIYTPNGKFIATSGADGYVRFWNLETLKQEQQIYAHPEGVGALAFAPNGKLFFTATRPSSASAGLIKVWDMATFKVKNTIKDVSSKVVGLAVSPDNTLLAMGGGLNKQFGEVKIFDLATGAERASFRDHKEVAECIVFSPDGNWLVSGGGYTRGQRGEIHIWDAKRFVGKGE